MKNTSRNVKVDPGKSVILRSLATQNLLGRGDVREVYPEQGQSKGRSTAYQFRVERAHQDGSGGFLTCWRPSY